MHKTQITPLYEILIQLEESGNLDYEEIRKLGNAVSRGVIGKMEAMKLIERTETQGRIFFKLSQNGYEYLNKVLNALHEPIRHWDGMWRVVWFSIPESNRSVRDKFRRNLESIGMRPILNSAWISPCDLKSHILESAKALNILDKILYVETANIEGISKDEIVKSWDFEASKDQYEEFIKKAQDITNSKDSNKLAYKRLILEYAIIINNEPKLPIELFPSDWPKFRATLLYKKAKRLMS